ncbi:caspase family protein [uncultured Alsobacter sp.]|uniref:caspase family protein n=1 Tax=uncultured Alsobacter sp. TaxID=1748258 RepID=UPI0025E27953|nr:caspase family protein [uncultured Alsobacter sp.]
MVQVGRWCAAALAAWLWLVPLGARAETRIALLIGNAGYQGVSPLLNPPKDVALLSEALGKAGFEVRIETDLSGEAMRRTLRDFASDAERADWAIVYYAGHGLEMGGQNFLVPVDARLQTDRDVPFETVALDQVLQSVEGARKLRLVIVDACRNNPFAPQMRTSSATRSTTRGLARVDPDGGTLVAYAAKVGQVALDGDGQNSPFVTALAKAVSTQGLELNKVFRAVRDDVLKSTGRRQEPYVYGSLPADDFYFVPPAAAQPLRLAASDAAADTAVQAEFMAARRAGTAAAWDVFLARNGKGFYADLARGERERLVESRPGQAPVPDPATRPAVLAAATARDSHVTADETAAVSSARSRVDDFLRSYAGGDCFAARPMGVAAGSGESALRVEAFGPVPAPFSALDDAFKTRFGAEAQIRARLVSPAQCGAVTLMKELAWGNEAGPQIFMPRTLVRPGQPLAAVVSNLGSRSLALVVVAHDGTLYDLTPQLRRRDGLAVLSARPSLPAASLEKPQLALAIATDKPLRSLGGKGRTGEARLAALLEEVRERGDGAAVAAAYWRPTAAVAPTDAKPWTP